MFVLESPGIKSNAHWGWESLPILFLTGTQMILMKAVMDYILEICPLTKLKL